MPLHIFCNRKFKQLINNNVTTHKQENQITNASVAMPTGLFCIDNISNIHWQSTCLGALHWQSTCLGALFTILRLTER